MDLVQRKDAELTITGRHDPCILHRALPVIEAAAALAAGVELVVIRRPRDRGEGLEDILAWFQADKEEAEWK